MADKKKLTFQATTPVKAALGQTKFKKVRADEPLYIVVDAGNSDIKAMIHGNFGEEIVFPHSIRQLTDAEYDVSAQSFRNRNAEFRGTSIFKTNEGCFEVGYHAYHSGQGVTKRGAEKYSRSHMGVLIEAVMLQLYPEGHSDVHLVVLHPNGLSSSNMNALVESVGGVHRVTTIDNNKIVYKVREVITNEEAVSSIQSWLLTVEGKPYQKRPITLAPGSQLLMVDIGGWISYMGYARINNKGAVEPNTINGTPINVGIEHIRPVFEKSIKQTHSELDTIQTLPASMIYDGLMHDSFRIGSQVVECKREADASFGVLKQRLEEPYNQIYAKGVAAQAILVSGGGGGVCVNYMIDHLFGNRQEVYQVEEDIDRMRYSAIRGASKGLYAYLKFKRTELA